jgi:hypothetical protein
MYIYTCSSVAEYHALYLSACEKLGEREKKKKRVIQQIRLTLVYISNT